MNSISCNIFIAYTNFRLPLVFSLAIKMAFEDLILSADKIFTVDKNFI